MTSTTINDELIKEMAQKGVLYGHKKSKTHPKMRLHIGANRNEIELLEPESILNSLQKATNFLKDKISKGNVVLLVSTLPASKEAIKNLSDTFGFPNVTNRWLGGTLTNFKIIKERLNHYENLQEQKVKGQLSKYTKKEQLEFDKELEKLSQKFDGLTKLEKTPDALFIIDPEVHSTAVREANKSKIPIVAILDTDDDPDLIDYPIIANDHAKSSIDWIVDKIITEVQDTKKESKNTEQEVTDS